MANGQESQSPNQPDQERTTAYRDSSVPESRSGAHYATVVGDWEEPCGDSRVEILDNRSMDYEDLNIGWLFCFFIIVVAL